MKVWAYLFLCFLLSNLWEVSRAEPVFEIESSTVATKEERLHFSPSEKVITETNLESSPGISLLEKLKQNSEFSISENPGGVSSLFFRGADSDKVLVLLDGVPLNDPTAPSGGFDFSLLDPSLIQEIRFWPATESVLWGTGGLGGVLWIETKKISSRSKQILMSLGSQNLHRTFFSIDEKNPDESSWSYRIIGSGLQQEGLSSSSLGIEKDPKELWNGAIVVEKKSDESSHRFFFQHQQGYKKTDHYVASTYVDDDNAGSNFQNWILSLQDQRSFQGSSSNLETMMSLRKILRHDFDPADAGSAQFSFSKENATESSFKSNYTLEKEFWSLDAGVALKNTLAVFESQDSLFGNTDFSKSEVEAAAYSRLQTRFEKWKIEPGLRLPFLGVGSPLGSLRVEYALRPHKRIELGWTVGVKNPTLYQRFSLYGNSTLNSEKVDQIHFGFFHGGPLTWKFLYSQSWYRDLIQYDLGLMKYGNVAVAQIQSFELKSLFEIGSHKFEWGWTEVFAKDQNNVSLLRRPRQQLSLSDQIQFQKLTLTPHILWKGSREDMQGSTRAYLSSYTQVDLSALYQVNSNFQTFAQFQNLFSADTTEAFGYSHSGVFVEMGLSYSF